MWPFITIFILTAVVTFMPSQILENVIGHNFDGSFTSRLGICNGCLKMIKLKPLTAWGLTGITYHGTYFMKGYYYETLYHGHNIRITIMTFLGIVGLFIYAYMMINLFRKFKDTSCTKL